MRQKEAQASVKTGLLGWMFRIKTVLIVISLVGLLASNVASVLNAGFHDFLYMGIRKVLLIAGTAAADLATSRSKTAEADARVKKETEMARNKSAEAEAKAADADKRRVKAEADLDGERAKVKRANLDLDKVKAERSIDAKEAKAVAARVRTRLAAGVAREAVSLPAQAGPIVGVVAIVSMATWDLYDACQTMKDFNDLLKKLGQGTEDDSFCGTKLPTAQQLLDSWRSNGRAAYEQSRTELAKMNLEIPAVRMPSREDLCPKWLSGCGVP